MYLHARYCPRNVSVFKSAGIIIIIMQESKYKITVTCFEYASDMQFYILLCDVCNQTQKSWRRISRKPRIHWN
jgi:hypothetical protein